MTKTTNSILKYLEKKGKSNFDKLRKDLKISGEDELASFSLSLKKLEEEGKIYCDSQMYQLFTDDLALLQGPISINLYGVGHIAGPTKQILISFEDLNGALDGDTVIVNDFFIDEHDILRAKVKKIITRKNGIINLEFKGGKLVPIRKYNIEVKLSGYDIDDLVEGDRIYAVIEGEKINNTYTANYKCLIGHKDDPDLEKLTIATQYGFYPSFSEHSLKEIEKIPNRVLEEEYAGRIDLRSKKFFTIDCAHTKDMDDAIAIEINDKGNYILYVSIADVSHYVKPNSSLFGDALDKGNSLYLSDSVMPMLPHKLSNGICSLNPNVDRLTKTVELEINKEGKVLDYDIYYSVINSKMKMNYDDVNLILEKNNIIPEYDDYLVELNLLKQLSSKLEIIKKDRGYLDFDSLELDFRKENGKLMAYNRYQKTAEKIIENCMLLANEAVATNFKHMEVPFAYRNHDDPNPILIEKTLNNLIEAGLINDAKMDICLKNIQSLLEKYKKTDVYSIISDNLLRGMARAIYEEKSNGHFGLGLNNYTHFTSPIRRFADLTVHSLIDRYYKDGNYDELEELSKNLKHICEHISFKEKMADEAERENEKLEMTNYILDHIDEYSDSVLEATIIWIYPGSILIELPNHIRGKIRTADLHDGYVYYYDPNTYSVVGRYGHSKIHYNIGDKILVSLIDVNKNTRNITFNLEGKKEIQKVKRK